MEVVVYATGAVGCALVTPVSGTAEAIFETIDRTKNPVIVDSAALPSRDQSTWAIVNGTVVVASADAIAANPPPPPASISRRQFFQQLAVQGIITNTEALAAMSGTIPSELATLIAALPSGEQFAASMLVSGATSFERANSFTGALGAAYNLTSAQIDAIWTAANAL